MPHNNATSLQVTAAALAGVIWAIENPTAGIVEPDEIDHERVLEIARPYLGELVGVYSDWTPLQDRGVLFPEDLDTRTPGSSRTSGWCEECWAFGPTFSSGTRQCRVKRPTSKRSRRSGLLQPAAAGLSLTAV